MPLQLDALAVRPPACPGVRQQQVPLRQVLLLLVRRHLAELLALLHGDSLDVLLNDLLLALHVGGHRPRLHLPNHPRLTHHLPLRLLLLLLRLRLASLLHPLPPLLLGLLGLLHPWP